MIWKLDTNNIYDHNIYEQAIRTFIIHKLLFLYSVATAYIANVYVYLEILHHLPSWILRIIFTNISTAAWNIIHPGTALSIVNT